VIEPTVFDLESLNLSLECKREPFNLRIENKENTRILKDFEDYPRVDRPFGKQLREIIEIEKILRLQVLIPRRQQDRLSEII